MPLIAEIGYRERPLPSIILDDGNNERSLIGMCIRCHRVEDMTVQDEWCWYDLPLCAKCEDESFEEMRRAYESNPYYIKKLAEQNMETKPSRYLNQAKAIEKERVKPAKKPRIKLRANQKAGLNKINPISQHRKRSARKPSP
jgi:hypothetical protein